MEENIAIGGNIQLTGFHELEPAMMIVLKKIIGNHARKFSDQCTNFNGLHLTLKIVHKTDKSEKYELHGMLIANDKQYTSEITERNLFFALAEVLKKLEKEVENK